MKKGVPKESDLPRDNWTLKLKIPPLDMLVKIASTDKGLRGAAGSRENKASKDIAHLNAVFQCPLSKAGSIPVKLTTEGQELAKISGEFFRAIEDFRTKCLKLLPTIRIGAGDSLVNWVILPALKDFSWAESTVFSVRQGGTTGLIAQVRVSEIDFAIIPESAPIENSWNYATVGTYQYCVCCRADLLKGGDLNEEILEELKFALITDHWRLDFKEKARVAGIKIGARFMCENFTQVATLVRTGAFAGILPVSTLSSFKMVSSKNSGLPGDEKSFRWLRPKFLSETDRTINLVWKQDGAHSRKHVNEIAQPLLEILRQELQAKQNYPIDAI